MRFPKLLFSACLCGLLLVGVFGFVKAPVAHATSLLLCAGTETQQYNPAITNTPQNVQATIDDSFICPLLSQVTGGTFHNVITLVGVSCTQIIEPALTFTETYEWIGGQDSVVSFSQVERGK